MELKVSSKAMLPGTYMNLDWCRELSTNELNWENKWPPKLFDKKGTKGNIYGDPPSRSMKNNQLFHCIPLYPS